MFSATLSKDVRPVCKKFMQDPMEVYVDDEAKLTLHGLRQHYVKMEVRPSFDDSVMTLFFIKYFTACA